MIKLTTENTQQAVKRCKQSRSKVRFVAERTFFVQSANNANSYTIRFVVIGNKKFRVYECKASEKGLVCYHIIEAATANIYRQSLKRQTA